MVSTKLNFRFAKPFRKEWLRFAKPSRKHSRIVSRSHQWSHPQNRKFSGYDLVTFRRHQRQPFHPTANSTFQVTRILEKFFCWCVIPWWISHPKHRRKVVACHKWNHRVMLVFINTRGEKSLFNCLETYISSLFLLALLCNVVHSQIGIHSSVSVHPKPRGKGVVRNSVVVVVSI